MDSTDESCCPVIAANGDYPVRSTEEVLHPFFTDESLQAAMDPQHPPASRSITPALSELRLVLLGRKGAGKSAAGNTILGGVGGFESGRPTEECVKRRADVAGRKVTVVDTPGWEWYYPLNSTPNWVRRETLRSVSLCPPGPHAVLLVVRACASVTEGYISEMEEHLEPLGRDVWDHTMLLFTRGDELGLASMEQRILTSGAGLQRLLQKCGDRYHVVDNRSRGDGAQVPELIRKLEEMVAAKKGGRSSHLEMDNSVLLGLEADGKRRARERRKKQRQMEEQMQRGTIKAALMSDGLQGSELDAHQSFSKSPRRLPEVRLVLLGERETGKSSAGNAILGGAGFFQAGAVTEECMRQQAEVAMRLVTVVDTPGWEEGVAGATPERVKREVVNSVALCPPGPHAVLLTLRVDTLVRAGHVREHLELLGDGVWRHTILLFTHGDQLRAGVDIEQHIQGGGRDLQGLLDRCRGRYHVISSVDGTGRGNENACKATELLQKVEKMAAMNRCEAFSCLVHEVRDLSRQRNEKFSQRLKDMGDKMLRQEVELKNMREREMKSIRWIFDRKKKVKSPGKADIQREEEEEEDRRTGERRNDIGELEERMQWLTEDKEREIQDLNIEKERIRVALNQIRGERDKAMLNMELKEREVEELKERIDEQQLKMLDLERANVENEHKRKQREEAIKVRTHEWMSEVKKLEETIELQGKEKAELMEKVDSLRAEIDQTKRHYDGVLERKAQEKNREMAETVEKLKAEMEIKLLEKDKEWEELREKASEEKQITLDNVKQMERKVEEMERKRLEKEAEMRNIKQQHQEEMTRKMSEIEKIKALHQKEIDQKLKDGADDRERVRQQHDGEMREVKREKQREIDELKEHFAKERRELKQANDRQIAELEQRYLVQMEGKMLENKEEREKILLNLSKDMAEKMREKEKEIEVLKTQQQEEMERKTKEFERATEARRAEHLEEIERKVKEKEEDVKRVRQEHSDKIKDVEGERQRERSQFEKQLQDRLNEMRDLEQKYEARIKEKMQETEKEKRLMSENHKKETEQLIEELKQKHKSEIEAKTQESDNEKDKIVTDLRKQLERKLEEKEREMEEVKVSVREMREELQQKAEKESANMKDKEEMERRLGEKEKEIKEMKLNVREVKETLQQKEEKERQDMTYRKDLEQRLEERERETKAMKERLNELQQQLNHAEERERESSNTKKLMEQKLEENERLIEKLTWHIKDIDEILQRKEDERGEIILNQKREAEQRLRDREQEMEEMKRQILDDTESKLSEKQSEVESLKRRFDSEETRWRDEQRMRDERGEGEINRLLGIISEKAKEITETRRLLAERDGEIEEAKRTSANNLKEIEALQTSVKDQASRIEEMQRHHAALESRKDAEVVGKLQEKDEELDRLRQRDGENEKELVHLRLTIEQTKSELKQLAGKMEKETTSMIQEYEKEIARRDESIEAVAKERDRLQEESRRSISDVTEKYEASRRRLEELQEENEKMRKEAENLNVKCEEVRKASEEEVSEHLKRYDLQVKEMEAEIQSFQALKEANDELKVEIERMKEREGEAERRMNDVRERFQTELEEKGEKTREEVLKREEEVGEREREVSRNEAGLSKRRHELDLKEGELAEKEAKLESKEQELGEREAGLEKQEKEVEEEKDRLEKDVRTRAKNMAKKERELEGLLGVLEGKQQELNCHGQDLQKKVRGLKDQGKELKDKEFHLRNEEQEMLSWMSRLQLQNEHVHSTTQELDEMGRDLALLKDELRGKEENLRAAFRKLSEWERDLKEREAAWPGGGSERRREDGGDGGVGERGCSDLTAESAEGESGSIRREVNGRKGEARGREADRGESDGEDQRAKTALSAKESNNCLLGTMTEEKEGERGEETRRKKDPERAEVSRGLQFLSARRSRGSSNNKKPPGSDLRVVVLGESWSPRPPAGLGILCGEASEDDGATFRRWRGQVAGRRLAVVEPLGLRWRDGPDPADATQQRSIRDGASWCHPGPDVVLLLVPAFLACTPKYRRAAERHVGLLGEDVWRRALVLFTWGETLGESAEQHILRNGSLMELVERCGGRFHVVTSKRNNSAIEGLLEKMEDMQDVNSV